MAEETPITDPLQSESPEELIQKLESNTPLKDFVAYHNPQLSAVGFPQTYSMFEKLYDKLTNQVYDAGNYFQIMEDPGNETYRLMSLKDINVEDNEVFLVDHAFSYRYKDLRLKLEDKEGLRNRISSMLKMVKDKETLRDQVFYSDNKDELDLQYVAEFDNMDLVDPTDAF